MPGVAGKPRKLGGLLAMDYGADRLAETTDFIDNTSRIEKGMQVAIVDRNGLLMRCNWGAAGTAQY